MPIRGRVVFGEIVANGVFRFRQAVLGEQAPRVPQSVLRSDGDFLCRAASILSVTRRWKHSGKEKCAKQPS